MSKIYTSYHYLFIFMLLVLLSIFSTCTAEEIISSPENPVKIIDGDSLQIGSERIRLMGIDAPEYDQYCKDKNFNNYPCGKKATEFLKDLIKTDNIVCKIHKKDQYERNLCTCYKQTTDINAALVRNGHALVYMESPYQKEEAAAKREKLGLWQGRFMQPRLFRRLKEEKK